MNTPKLTGKQVLVTGATGFIGRRLATAFDKAGISVIASGRRYVEGPWQQFQRADLTDPHVQFSLRNTDAIVHLASKAHAVSECHEKDSDYKRVIVEGTRRVVDAAERDGVRCFVYVSSVKVMGNEAGIGRRRDRPITEADPSHPQTPYGRCKLEAESIALQSSIPHVVVLRPVMVYGPGHKGNLVRMAEAIRRKRFPPIAENGNRRSMVHVDDVVEACMLASHSEDRCNRGIYIIASEPALSTRSLYDSLRREMGMRPLRWSFPGWPLRLGAIIGDLMEEVTGKRMPINGDLVSKLIGDAWFSGCRSQEELGIIYKSVEQLLGEGQSLRTESQSN